MYKIINAIKNPQLLSEVKKNNFRSYTNAEFKKLLIKMDCIDKDGNPSIWADRLRLWDNVPKFTKGGRDKFGAKRFNMVVSKEGVRILKELISYEL